MVSKYTPRFFTAGAPPLTPLGEFTAFLQTRQLCLKRRGTERGEEGKKEVLPGERTGGKEGSEKLATSVVSTILTS